MWTYRAMNSTEGKPKQGFSTVVSRTCHGNLCHFDLCRLCMAQESSSRKLMQVTDTFPAGSDILISQMIWECLSINVADEVTNAMNQVCQDCVTDLYSFSKFKERCSSVDNKLRQIMLRSIKISEAQALYGQEIPDSTFHDTSPFNDTSILPCASLCVGDTQYGIESSMESSQMTSLNGMGITIGSKLDFSHSSQSKNVDDESGTCNNITQFDKSNSCSTIDDLVRTDDARNAEIDLQHLTDIELYSEDIGTDPHDEDEVEIQVSAGGESNIVKVVGKVPNKDVPQDNSPSPKPKPQSLSKGIASPVPGVLVVLNEDGRKQLAFRCQECGIVFKNKVLHRGHIASHNNQKGHVCRYCEKWFPVKSALVRHERTHSGEKPHTCILCDRSFSQKEILQRHISTHTDSKPFPCPHCEKGYTQKEALKMHLKSTHIELEKVTQYPCPLCEKAFCHPSGLSRHMQSHVGKRFLCANCSLSFGDSSSLRRHQRKVHSVESSCKSDVPYYQLLHEPL